MSPQAAGQEKELVTHVEQFWVTLKPHSEYHSRPMSEHTARETRKHDFKTCRSCRIHWADLQQFVYDPGVSVLGLQAITSVPDGNLLMFEHRCGSTISVRAKLIRQMFPEPEENTSLPLQFEKDGCEGHCRSVEDLTACRQPCINARDRRLLLRLLEIKQHLK